MAPLSVVPGRIRIEILSFKDRPDCCCFFMNCMATVNGVIEANANHRTGRVLVRFDERVIGQPMLKQHIERTIADSRCPMEGNLMYSRQPVAGGGGTSNSGYHLLLEVVAHAILPKPLDLLLPAAVSTLLG